MRQGQTKWLWLVEPEDSSSSEGNGMLSLHSARSGKRILALAKFFLWYGAGILLGLCLARLH